MRDLINIVEQVSSENLEAEFSDKINKLIASGMTVEQFIKGAQDYGVKIKILSASECKYYLRELEGDGRMVAEDRMPLDDLEKLFLRCFVGGVGLLCVSALATASSFVPLGVGLAGFAISFASIALGIKFSDELLQRSGEECRPKKKSKGGGSSGGGDYWGGGGGGCGPSGCPWES